MLASRTSSKGELTVSDTRESEDKQKSEGENHEMRNRPTLSTKMFFSRKPFASTVLPLLLRLICLAAVLVPCHGQRALFNLGKRVANKSSDTRAGSVRAAATDDDSQIPKLLGPKQKADLSFEGIYMALANKKNKGNPRVVLDGSLRGRAQPGRMLVIMGPSGAGKSTLLHALAGRIPESSKVKSLSGSRYLNGVPLPGDARLPDTAVVEQEVNFFPHMTVRETLEFRVALEMGSALTTAQQQALVQDLLQQMRLTDVADTVVGNAKVRGISGGERKRLSVAVELIQSPSLLLLDEPTSGLDSTAAATLIDNLRTLANEQGKTIVAVLHQPSQQVFRAFDDLLLLAEGGKLMYFGELNQVRSYLAEHGYPAPVDVGTAEHVLNCISRQPLPSETEEEATARVNALAAAARRLPIDLGTATPTETNTTIKVRDDKRSPRAGIVRQFELLFRRSFREVTRGRTAIIVKIFQQITLGLVYGGIYKLGKDQASIQDRFGLLSLVAIGSANMALASTIRAFPREKSIISKEIASNMYRTLPYFISKALSELPLVGVFNGIFGVILYKLTGLSTMAGKFVNFLGLLTTHGLACEATGLVVGAISPNSDVALALFPAILVLNVIFDGKNISGENVPRLLRWIPKISLIRWGFEGLCLNEFDGLKFDSSSHGPRRGPVAHTGAEALGRFGLGGNTLGDVFRVQLTMTVACWVLSYLGLTLTTQQYMVMDPASGSSTGNSALDEEDE